MTRAVVDQIIAAQAVLPKKMFGKIPAYTRQCIQELIAAAKITAGFSGKCGVVLPVVVLAGPLKYTGIQVFPIIQMQVANSSNKMQFRGNPVRYTCLQLEAWLHFLVVAAFGQIDQVGNAGSGADLQGGFALRQKKQG